MKSLFLMFLTVAAFSVKADIGNTNRGMNLKYDGTIDASTVENRFINVKNGSGGALAVGKVVVWDLTADDAATVTTSASAGQSPVCIIAKACAIAALCSCQHYGYISALFDSTANNAVAGSRWYMSSASAGYVSARGTSLATEVPGGIFFDAASASGSVEIFISL